MLSVPGTLKWFGAVVLTALAPVPAASQLPSSSILTSGSHLRVHRQGTDSAVSGRLRLMSNDSLMIAPDDDPSTRVAFATADIAGLEIERDLHTRDQATVVMAAIGAVGGITSAMLWCKNNQAACAADEQRQQTVDCDSTYYGVQTLMFLGGTLLGGLIGYALAPSPHWDVVAIPTRTTDNGGSSHLMLNVGVRYWLAAPRRSFSRAH
jgi:hypothetical protein